MLGCAAITDFTEGIDSLHSGGRVWRFEERKDFLEQVLITSACERHLGHPFPFFVLDCPPPNLLSRWGGVFLDKRILLGTHNRSEKGQTLWRFPESEFSDGRRTSFTGLAKNFIFWKALKATLLRRSRIWFCGHEKHS